MHSAHCKQYDDTFAKVSSAIKREFIFLIHSSLTVKQKAYTQTLLYIRTVVICLFFLLMFCLQFLKVVVFILAYICMCVFI